MEIKISALNRINLFLRPAPSDEPPGGGGGGGTTNNYTPSLGGGTVFDANLVSPTGGLFIGDLGLLIPVFDLKTGTFYTATFDHRDFNTESLIRYKYREEAVLEGRETTISRVRFRYRDLGVVKLSVSILTDKYREPNEKNTKVITLGTKKAPGTLKWGYADLVVTGHNPQLFLQREANAGPLCITKSQLITDIEVTEQV